LIEFTAGPALAASIFAVWLGAIVNERVPALRRFSIPAPITGGVICVIAIALVKGFASVDITWELGLRDELLLVFFSGVGLSAKLGALRQGGALFGRLALYVVLFLFVQNAAGILLAIAMGNPATHGLVSGSIAFAGGHGTAISWGQIAAGWGYDDALAHGLAFATVGLIAGGLIGGPFASWIIRRNNLAKIRHFPGLRGRKRKEADENEVPLSSRKIMFTFLILALCVGAGVETNALLEGVGIVVPGFLTAMLAGVLLTNLVDLVRVPLHTDGIEFVGDLSLNLFLAMSLISLDLAQLATIFAPLSAALVLQVAVALAFALWVVFPGCGRDYNASVLASGFLGIGLGATPVGMANMEAVTKRFGPAPRALLILPLIGAGVLDIANAFVIEVYVRLFG
jgi:ESS family glutamate:Na+ symporter